MCATSSECLRIYDDIILRQPARDITRFDNILHELIERLFAVQAREKAIGVAAPQIGESWNVFVLNGGAIRRGGKPEVYINSHIVEAGGAHIDDEGCLSFPNIFIPIERPKHVQIEAFDADGNRFERAGTGLRARAYSHETDHLQGRLIIDRVPEDVRQRVIAKMKSMKASRRE